MPATTAPATRVPAPLPDFSPEDARVRPRHVQVRGDAPRASPPPERRESARGGRGGGRDDDDATRARAAETDGAVRARGALGGGRVACHLVHARPRRRARLRDGTAARAGARGRRRRTSQATRARARPVRAPPRTRRTRGSTNNSRDRPPVVHGGVEGGGDGAVFELKDSDGFVRRTRRRAGTPANAENRADAEGAGAKPRTCVRLRRQAAAGHPSWSPCPSRRSWRRRGGRGRRRRDRSTGGGGSDEGGCDEGGADDASRRRRSRSNRQRVARAARVMIRSHERGVSSRLSHLHKVRVR